MKKYAVIKMVIPNVNYVYLAYFKTATNDLGGEKIIAEFDTIKECEAFIE